MEPPVRVDLEGSDTPKVQEVRDVLVEREAQASIHDRAAHHNHPLRGLVSPLLRVRGIEMHFRRDALIHPERIKLGLFD